MKATTRKVGETLEGFLGGRDDIDGKKEGDGEHQHDRMHAIELGGQIGLGAGADGEPDLLHVLVTDGFFQHEGAKEKSVEKTGEGHQQNDPKGPLLER